MKSVALFFAVLVTVQAANLAPEKPIPILHQEQEVNFDGSYKSFYETGNGIVAEEHGVLTNPGTKEESEEIVGFVSYTSPDGSPVSYNYTADKDGFHVVGDHLPKAPVDPNPIPPLIARSLEYNKAHPEEEKEDVKP